MGAYTNSTAVQSEFKGITFGASTPVTSDDVTEFIAQEESLLEGEVGTVYVTPVTGSSSLAIMKRMATLRVKARILDILPVKTGKDETDQGNPGDALRQIVQDMIDRIRKKELLLPDAVLVESSGGVASYTSSQGSTHHFQRDVEQW